MAEQQRLMASPFETIYQEIRRKPSALCQLPTIEERDNQETVPTSTDSRLTTLAWSCQIVHHDSCQKYIELVVNRLMR